MGNDAFSVGLGIVPVLDAAGAITLMDESKELYLEIAQAYVIELSSLHASLETALARTDLTEATRTLHTFKGLSLTVGAQRLSEICRRCELVLKTMLAESCTLDAVIRSKMTAALQEGTQQTAAELETYLKQQAQPTAMDASSSAQGQHNLALLNDLRDLRHLLARSDLAALDRFSALQTTYPDLAEPLKQLGLWLKAFDFSQAMVQCDELIRKCSPLAK
jgi:HPt (histidine-containing phosphotransfer) domain-containing protein